MNDFEKFLTQGYQNENKSTITFNAIAALITVVERQAKEIEKLNSQVAKIRLYRSQYEL